MLLAERPLVFPFPRCSTLLVVGDNSPAVEAVVSMS